MRSTTIYSINLNDYVYFLPRDEELPSLTEAGATKTFQAGKIYYRLRFHRYIQWTNERKFTGLLPCDGHIYTFGEIYD